MVNRTHENIISVKKLKQSDRSSETTFWTFYTHHGFLLLLKTERHRISDVTVMKRVVYFYDLFLWYKRKLKKNIKTDTEKQT